MYRFLVFCFVLASMQLGCSPTAFSPGEITLVDSVVIPMNGMESDRGGWIVQPIAPHIHIYSPIDQVFYRYDLYGHLLDSFAYTGLPESRFNYFLTDSSLIILNNNYNVITAYHKGRLKKYAEPDHSFVFSNLYFPLQIFPDNELFLYRIPNLYVGDSTQRAAYFTHPVLAACVLRDSHIVLTHQFGGFPETYQHQDYNEHHPQAAVVSSSQLAYIYSIEPVIYLYDKVQDTHREIKIPISPNIRRPYGSDFSINASKKYELENEKYHKLLFDAVREKFILFRGHIVEEGNDPFEMKIWSDKSFTMYVIALDGRVEAQTRVSSLRGYFIPSFFAHDGQVYLGRPQADKMVYEIWRY